MKTRLYTLLFGLFLIFGCANGGGGGQISLDPFIGGNTGLSVAFEPNAPPAETFDGGFAPFDVAVRLENKGEWPVTKDQVEVRVSGVRAQEFSLTEDQLIKKPDDDLLETRKDPSGRILESGPAFVEFKDFNHVTFITGSQTDFTIRADVCYEYGTKAISKLCVRKNLLNPEEGGLCTLSENKPVFNSGSPVHVQNVAESTRSRDRIAFTFDVSHVGTGKVFEQGSNCDVSLRRYEDRVKVRVDTGIDGLACSGLNAVGEGIVEGFVSLFGGTRTISCTQTVTNRNDYETPVDIQLTYDYQQLQDTRLVVKSSGEE